MVRTGLDEIRSGLPSFLKEDRIGLLAHPASVDSRLVHAREICSKIFSNRLTVLFSPQHGIFGEQQDNMVESAHGIDPDLGIPVYSLYSEVRKPTPEMFSEIDTLVVDLQDVGTRVYTFIYTLANCMDAAREAGIRIVVLDRPNPIGGIAVEGNLLREDHSSFVGRFPIPMRHGMTIGELAGMFNNAFGIGCDLEVISMRGWRRGMYFAETGLPWVLPSPNLPTPETALVYPGQVLLEGTNLSEGRGTTRPFELFGAPYLDTKRAAERLAAYDLPGVIFREHHFLPTFQKWEGTLCHGFQLHVTDRKAFRPYRSTLAVLQSVLSSCPGKFEWRKPPYEYETKKLPIDILTGDPAVREALEGRIDPVRMERGWEEDLSAFRKDRRKYLLYPD
ncbi:MAG: DUF1343 domain-containing protein [Deltaproteobacteria bacterium]|nr:DUF1343 domain-containing protein [Deltaproteobacteria bacterium]